MPTALTVGVDGMVMVGEPVKAAQEVGEMLPLTLPTPPPALTEGGVLEGDPGLLTEKDGVVVLAPVTLGAALVMEGLPEALEEEVSDSTAVLVCPKEAEEEAVEVLIGEDDKEGDPEGVVVGVGEKVLPPLLVGAAGEGVVEEVIVPTPLALLPVAPTDTLPLTLVDPVPEGEDWGEEEV